MHLRLSHSVVVDAEHLNSLLEVEAVLVHTYNHLCGHMMARRRRGSCSIMAHKYIIYSVNV